MIVVCTVSAPQIQKSSPREVRTPLDVLNKSRAAKRNYTQIKTAKIQRIRKAAKTTNATITYKQACVCLSCYWFRCFT